MEKFNSKCVQYEGECLEQIEACKGEDLEKIIININDYLKFLLDTINSNILIENVGEGEKIFKGKSGDIIPSYEFRSLLESESLNLKLLKNEIEFSVNEEWLTNYIQNFSTNIFSPKNTIITNALLSLALCKRTLNFSSSQLASLHAKSIKSKTTSKFIDK